MLRRCSNTCVLLSLSANIAFAAEEQKLAIERISKSALQASVLRESLNPMPQPKTVAAATAPVAQAPPSVILPEPGSVAAPRTEVTEKVLSGIKAMEQTGELKAGEPIEVDAFLSRIGLPEPSQIQPAIAAGNEAQNHKAVEKPEPIMEGSVDAIDSAEPFDSFSFRVRVLRTPAEAMRLCDEFLLHIINAQHDEGFRVLKEHFPITEYKFEQLREDTKKRLGMAELRFGRPLDYVFVGADTMGDTVLRYRYLEKFDLETLLWEFTFYQPKRGWLLNALSFEAEVGQVFRD